MTPVVPLPLARRIWLGAQRLDAREPFGAGPAATRLAIEHLGYVQIDTINVVERAHHHILFTRIPGYRRSDLVAAQSIDKSVFEYWTHALAYVPTRDLRFFLPEMKRHRGEPSRWYADADPRDLRRLLSLIRRDGPISIRDIDDEPVEKDHPWASRKPSKRVLQLGFFNGVLAISRRDGMVKTYDLMERHFGWERRPSPATPRQIAVYRLDRALRAQGLVSGPSLMHPWLRSSPDLQAEIDRRVKRRELVPVTVEGDDLQHYAHPATLDAPPPPAEPLTHVLSPFDPLVILRRRLAAYFGYEHVFEAYVPRAKRRFGYFTLPVLHGDEIVAALDLKADRAAGTLLVQAWHWVGSGGARPHKRIIEAELDRFAAFQFAAD